MQKFSYYSIYVGVDNESSYRPPRPYIVPAKWRPLLALAYAYTTYSINETFLDFYDVQATVNAHSSVITELSEKLALLSTIDEDFIDVVNELGTKIDRMDPDLLTSLAYTYTLLNRQIAQDNAYSYAYSLYNTGVKRSYDRIQQVNNNLVSGINSLHSYVENNFARVDYVNDNFAYKSDVPEKISQLINDSGYITSASLNQYITTSEVDERIENIIGTAPEILDTLGEIANALGDDPNLAGTLTEQISQKADLSYVTELYNKTSVQNDDIPIYDAAKIEELIATGDMPDKYISIPSQSEMFENSDEGRYLDIIFKTLRNLQQHVSKLERTFDKGIISMTNENTRMSAVSQEYYSSLEQEPMWAVDPYLLPEISGTEFYIDNAHTLQPAANVTISSDKLHIEPYATWNDNHINITSNQPDNYLHDCPDAKEYVYITASNTNIIISLTNYDDEEDIININLHDFNISPTDAEKFNILLCVSRAVLNDKNKYAGSDFIFLSIADYFSGTTVCEGYIKNGRIYDRQVILNSSNADNDKFRYFISKIQFNNVDLYRLSFHSRYQDFGNDVQPSVPDDDDTYSVAHITIRSVKNIEQLKNIKNQLLENELIYNDSNNCIYIIKNNEIKLISGGSSNIDPSDDITGMEKDEIIRWLADNGIIVTEDGGENISFNNVGDITFINSLNKKYKFSVDSEGNLKSTLIDDKTLAQRLNKIHLDIDESITPADFINTRGFVGTLREYETNKKPGTDIVNSDMKLNSDRVKIGNIYAPFNGSNVHGCTHGYIELENTSNLDFQLDGCYIHFVRRIDSNTVEENSLPLSGVLPANSTYLIRCKKYSDISQSNTFIDVDSFDIEWITPQGELFDIYLGIQNTFLLTYGCPGKDWDPNSTFDYTTTMVADGAGTYLGNKVYHPCYIDSVSVIAHINRGGDTAGYTWIWNGKGLYANPNKLDALYKTTFELDPAKQAYQGLHAKDSSRIRTNTATDYQTVYLQKEFIEFPKTDEKYPVAMYTPMASYLHKNVCTDKTKLNMNKPNMVTCAFGIDMQKTRCFNWVSAGEFDEYIWIRKQGETSWKRFESYKTRKLGNLTKTVIGEDNKETSVVIGIGDIEYNNYRTKLNNNELTAPYRKEFMLETNNAIYARIKGTFPGGGVKYTAHKCILEFDAVTEKTTWEYIVGRGDKNINPDAEHISDIMTFTLYPASYIPRLYQTTDQQGFHWIEYQTWAAAADKINEMINTQSAAENIVPVVLNTGDATQNGTRVNEWIDYFVGGKNLFNHLEQMSIVGNNDLCDNNPEILGTGDDSGKSNGFYHHVFYCYEVDEKLTDNTYISKLETHNDGEDQTGDLTFNEVFNANRFKYLPLIKGSDNVYRYIPSFYWFGTNKYTFVMMNSELTYINCGQWFKKTKTNPTIDKDDKNQYVNLYTGWTLPADDHDSSIYDDSFTTIYTMLYRVINEHIANKGSYETAPTTKIENLIVACHEMPFTVVTYANLKIEKANADRSLNGTALVGSHMNMINSYDKKSNYWFSRLLEHFNVKLCYGGHKHTYAITNELRENYLYTVDGVKKSSLIDGKMSMTETLENDTVEWNAVLKKTDTTVPIETTVINETTHQPETVIVNETYSSIVFADGEIPENQRQTIALSKFPIMNVYDDVKNTSHKLGISFEGAILFPYYGVELNNDNKLGGVIYLMCQATGFKLKSNKELPGPNQRFSFIIPQTTPGDASDTPSDEQLQPMLTEIHPDTHEAYLMRLKNIHSGKKVLSQTDYATAPIAIQYLHRNNINTIDMYGKWSATRELLLRW